MTQTTPIWKIAATVGGTALTGAAVALNASTHAEGWNSPLVAAAVIVTLCAACTPPFAERAAKTDQPAKAACLWLFFGLAVAFSLTSDRPIKRLRCRKGRQRRARQQSRQTRRRGIRGRQENRS